MKHNRLDSIRRYNGPTCGKRYLVNSAFDAANSYYRCAFQTDSTWIGVPRWHGRYKALKRSCTIHGRSVENIWLLAKATKEWRHHAETLA